MKLLYTLEDKEYPYTYIDHIRNVARAFVLNDKNEILLEYIYDDDGFGHRDYYETPGGGIKNGEDLDYKTYNNQSTEGGHLIADRILFPLEDGLRDSFENACSLDSMNQHDMSINVFEFFSYSDGETLILTPKNNVLLSTIITALQNTYQNGNIDVYWVACRS